jgi:hypothetical protein
MPSLPLTPEQQRAGEPAPTSTSASHEDHAIRGCGRTEVARGSPWGGPGRLRRPPR